MSCRLALPLNPSQRHLCGSIRRSGAAQSKDVIFTAPNSHFQQLQQPMPFSTICSNVTPSIKTCFKPGTQLEIPQNNDLGPAGANRFPQAPPPLERGFCQVISHGIQKLVFAKLTRNSTPTNTSSVSPASPLLYADKNTVPWLLAKTPFYKHACGRCCNLQPPPPVRVLTSEKPRAKFTRQQATVSCCFKASRKRQVSLVNRLRADVQRIHRIRVHKISFLKHPKLTTTSCR